MEIQKDLARRHEADTPQSVLLRLTVHELRRPLGVVDGYLSMIRDGTFGSPPAQEEVDVALSAMAGQVREMAALIDGLAAVARQEDRADVLRRRPCQLRDVVAAASAAVELEAHARRVRVDQQGPEVEADVDPDRLRVALVNLLRNAIRHSPADAAVGITIAADENAITIAVADRGPGIDAAEAERVFDRWYQGPSASDGLGLGLWIVRQIAEWHAGRVTLNSAPGDGSAFRIVLPSSAHTIRGRPT